MEIYLFGMKSYWAGMSCPTPLNNQPKWRHIRNGNQCTQCVDWNLDLQTGWGSFSLSEHRFNSRQRFSKDKRRKITKEPQLERKWRMEGGVEIQLQRQSEWRCCARGFGDGWEERDRDREGEVPGRLRSVSHRGRKSCRITEMSHEINTVDLDT